MALRPRHAFAREYLIDLNATQAAIRAGFSPKTAYSQGQRLLKNVEIQAEIQRLMAARAERTEITADRVLQELAKIGFGDIRNIFTPGGALMSPTEMDDAAAATIASIEVVEKPRRDGDGNVEIEYVRKVRLWDKRAALVDLGKHLKLFTEKVEHSGPDGGPIELNDTERAAKVAGLLDAARARREAALARDDEA